jgi:uncharacterized Zn finger protein
VPKYHIQNPKTLQEKSRKHRVVEVVAGKEYYVVSGTSGERYSVTIYQQSQYTIAASCTCNWGKYHPRSACSHVQAVVSEMFDGYRASAWGSMADAKRQHRSKRWIGDGVIMTLRKI